MNNISIKKGMSEYMDVKDNTTIAFGLILHAGDARSKAMEAVYLSREGHTEEALSLLDEAREELHLAHQSQTALLTAEANGEQYDLSILMVHAQDHLAMAISAIDNAEELIRLYSLVNRLLGNAHPEDNLTEGANR